MDLSVRVCAPYTLGQEVKLLITTGSDWDVNYRINYTLECFIFFFFVAFTSFGYALVTTVTATYSQHVFNGGGGGGGSKR